MAASGLHMSRHCVIGREATENENDEQQRLFMLNDHDQRISVLSLFFSG